MRLQAKRAVTTTVVLPVLMAASIAAHADTHHFEFTGKDTSAASSGELAATFQFSGDKIGSDINVSSVEIIVIDGDTSATSLFGALGMYALKSGTARIQLPLSGEPARPVTFTLTNGRDTKLLGNVWKLDISGKNATLRTRGMHMTSCSKVLCLPNRRMLQPRTKKRLK